MPLDSLLFLELRGIIISYINIQGGVYMKKLLLVLLALTITTSAFADRFVEARMGLSSFGSYAHDEPYAKVQDKTKGVGFDLAIEYLTEVSPKLYLGGGVGYQVNEDHKNSIEDEYPLFKSVPAYGSLKYILGYIGESAWATYAKGNFGFSFNFKDGGHYKPRHGLCWALGLGIENDGVLLEVSYQDTYAKVDHIKYSYGRFTFAVGYRFRNF